VKRIFTLTLLAIASLLSALALNPYSVSAADSYTQDFVISAYYSPIPGQARYATGSYSGDIRLNGNGVHTADGTAVANMTGGFVAAPPTFPFGTKMDIVGLGMFTVHDRGGAIKGSRLDVWMGYGDEGLNSALIWGKRTVSVTVYMDSPDIEDNNSIVSNYQDLPEYQKVTVDSPLEFDRELEKEDKGTDVARLQQFLKDKGYYRGKIDGVFSQLTEKSLIDFQKDVGILEDGSLLREGRFGSQTRLALQEAVLRGRDEYLENIPTRNLGRGAKGDEVRKLQEILKMLGYLENINGVYDAKTVDAVFRFQMSNDLIESENDSGAGYFGPATQLALSGLHLGLQHGVQVMSENNLELEEFGLELEGKDNVYLDESSQINFNLSEGDTGTDVYNLQLALNDLNFLRVEPSSYYGPLTTHAVSKFQLKVKLIDNKDDIAAGKVGPKTRQALNSYLNSKAKIMASKKSSSDERIAKIVQERKLLETAKLGDRNPTIKKLQSYLQSQGYYKARFTTEYFGDLTRESLISFQLDNDLAVDVDDENAGVLNKETLAFINKKI